MTIQAPSLIQFPADILGLISQQCDVKTLYAFRSTCTTANTIGKTEMSVETAARVVFHHPERYLDLKQNCLKESRAIVLNVLTKLPKLFFDPGLPDHFRHDVEMIKTAFVAAHLLHDARTEERIYEANADILGGIACELDKQRRILFMNIKDELAAGGALFESDISDTSELYQLQPLVCLRPPYNFCCTTPDIKKHLDIALEIVARNPYFSILHEIDISLRDNEELVRKAVRANPYDLRMASDRLRDNEDIVLEASNKNDFAFHYASDRLKDSNSFVWKAFLASQRGNVFHYASPRIQKNVAFEFLAICKNIADAVLDTVRSIRLPCCR